MFIEVWKRIVILERCFACIFYTSWDTYFKPFSRHAQLKIESQFPISPVFTALFIDGNLERYWRNKENLDKEEVTKSSSFLFKMHLSAIDGFVVMQALEYLEQCYSPSFNSCLSSQKNQGNKIKLPDFCCFSSLANLLWKFFANNFWQG